MNTNQKVLAGIGIVLGGVSAFLLAKRARAKKAIPVFPEPIIPPTEPISPEEPPPIIPTPIPPIQVEKPLVLKARGGSFSVLALDGIPIVEPPVEIGLPQSWVDFGVRLQENYGGYIADGIAFAGFLAQMGLPPIINPNNSETWRLAIQTVGNEHPELLTPFAKEPGIWESRGQGEWAQACYTEPLYPIGGGDTIPTAYLAYPASAGTKTLTLENISLPSGTGDPVAFPQWARMYLRLVYEPSNYLGGVITLDIPSKGTQFNVVFPAVSLPVGIHVMRIEYAFDFEAGAWSGFGYFRIKDIEVE